ncbi:MAG: head decoration protein [Caulobacteraceae bacterium]|nr:head decoration protein [Caulobacteraceae bacterium]
MTLNTNTLGDNPFQPGVVRDTYVPDQLIAGQFPLETQPVVLGAGALKRGTVLGAKSAQGVVAVAGTNTGNGTVGSLSRGAGALQGNYVLTATTATNFTVTDPEGNALPAATVGTAYSQSGINFTITAGGTAFVAGDSFTLESFDATGQYITSVATAVDGSQTPTAILIDDADATAGPVTAGVYLTGEFNGHKMIYDASWTLATLRAALRPSSIFVKDTVSASDPT